MPARICNTHSIAQLLGIGNEMRTQNPTPQKTGGKNPRWYIRPSVDKLRPDGSGDKRAGTCVSGLVR